jgi:hypothetical protein
MLDQLPVLDAILQRHAGVLGRDHRPYRHHAYRVANLYWSMLPGTAQDLYVLSVAAAFHDLGIWTAGSFDYLDPSKALARDYLMAEQKAELVPMVLAMIENHHRIGPVPGAVDRRVEAFRRADWIDVTLGLRRFDSRREDVQQIVQRFPRLGFHLRLVQFSLRHGLRHPLRPLPMFRR